MAELLLRRRDAAYANDLLVCAVAELDLFTHLAATPLAFDDLCARLRVRPRPAKVLLTLCRALGLIHLSEDLLFAPTEEARAHLVAGAAGDLRDYYTSLRDRPAVAELLAVLRTGEPASWASSSSGQDWASALDDLATAAALTAAMDARGRVLAPALADALDLSGRRRLLDVAGGSGIYARSLIERWPELRATVLERPPVDRAARVLGAPDGRVEVRTADMFNDPWPPNADVHLFSHVLHDWDEPDVRRLLSTSFAALAPGGVVVDFDAHLDDDCGPLPVAEYSVLLAHSTQGRCYSVDELSEWLREVGFIDVAVVPVTRDRSAVTALRP